MIGILLVALYFVLEIYVKGGKRIVLSPTFSFWLIVEHRVVSNCPNKINSKKPNKIKEIKLCDKECSEKATDYQS